MPQRREKNLLRCALLQLVSPSGLRGDAAAEEGRLSLQRLQQRKASGDEDGSLRRDVCIRQARGINNERVEWMEERSEWSCFELCRSGLPAVA